MELQREHSDNLYQIQSYQPGSLTISHKNYQSSLIVMADQLIVPWRPRCFTDFVADDFKAVIALQPEIVLFGTGEQLSIPPARLLAPLYQHGIKVEWMHTRAACYTFTILTSENRHVAAALLIE